MEIQKIQVLPDGVANQIAAGEVVGRPASVVKELMENAVDAGSTSIKVNFREGGRSLIQVIDNGCGMSTADARLAFERHATSKIRSVDDLSHLHSFGFRGEALPSIASVAEVEVRTRTAEDEVGTCVTINGGKFVSQEPVQTPQGTQFLVKNLFYNVPARRRFLKEPHIEARYLTAEFQRVALCYPEVAFALYNNDSPVYNLSKGNLRQRIAGVCGKDLANNLLEVSVDTSIIKIEGYVGLPSVARKTKHEQYLFVNGRYFRSPYFHKAVMQAYDKLISPDTQPPYFLYMTVAPKRIDVNVHPQKTEIKFEDEQAIWQIFNAAVRESLGKLGVVPMMDFDMDSSIDIPVYKKGTIYREPDTGANPAFNPFQAEHTTGHTQPLRGGGAVPRSHNSALDGWQQLYEIDSRAGVDADLTERFNEMDSSMQAFLEGTPEPELAQQTEPQQQRLDLNLAAGFRGQLKLTDRLYATALGDALVVVDVERARERVLFERYLCLLGNNAAVSQQLLFPEEVTFSPADGAVMMQIKEELSALGFEFEPQRESTRAEHSSDHREVAPNSEQMDVEVMPQTNKDGFKEIESAIAGSEGSGSVGVAEESDLVEYDSVALEHNTESDDDVTFVVTGIPPELPAGTLRDALHEVLACVHELGAVPHQQKLQDMAAVLARRGASSAAHIDEAAVGALLDELASCSEPAFTPSGKTVLVRISGEELSKRF